MKKSPFQHRHHLSAPMARAQTISDILDAEFEEDGVPVSHYEISEIRAEWGVAIYVMQSQSAPMKKRMINALAAHNISATINTEIIEETDWIAKTLTQLSPVRSGRFVVHGSHDRKATRINDFNIEIDAGLAFGTGHHGTTAGCLDMLAEQLKAQNFYNALDIGTGSGVLAIALAKATKRHVMASDIDPVSTQVTKQNAKDNGVGALITCVSAKGLNHNEIRNCAPYDLVIANILARPLQMLARDLCAHLAPGATIILSGLLPHQGARIIAAYRAQAASFVKTHYRDGWLTLVLKGQ